MVLRVSLWLGQPHLPVQNVKKTAIISGSRYGILSTVVHAAQHKEHCTIVYSTQRRQR